MSSAVPSPSAPRLDWIVAVLLSASVVWTTLGLGGYRPETREAPAVVTGLLLALVLARRASARESRPWHPAGWWPLPFLVYAAANVRWVSPVPWLGWADWIGWALPAAVCWIALNGLNGDGPRRCVHGAVAAVAAVSVGMAVYQRLVDPDWLMLGRTQSGQYTGRSSGSFGIPNSLAALLVLLLPVMLAAAAGPGSRWRRGLAGLLAAVYALGLVLTISRGAWLACGAALAVWPLLVPGRGWRARLGLALAAVAGAAAAGAALYLAVPQVKERFDGLVRDQGERTRPIMWRGAWALFREAPLTGTGGGSYNILFERHRPAGFRDEPQWPHNDYLNVLSDYGVAGFGLLATGLGLAGWAAARRRPEGARAEAGTRALLVGLFGFGLTMLIDFHLKIPALAMIAALALAELFRRLGSEPPPRPIAPASRVAAGVAAAAVLGVTVNIVWPHYRSEAARYGPRRTIDALAAVDADAIAGRDVIARARASFAEAVAINPANAQAWADLAYATALEAHHAPGRTGALGREAEAAARRALALSSAVPEFWWRLGVALDMQDRWVEAGPAFAEAVKLAPHSALAWYHQAYHFSLKPATRALARASAATCLQLDPGYRSADALLRALTSAP